MPVRINKDEVVINACNSEVRISLFGATVYSWKAYGKEHFFVSSKSPVGGPKALRGGIPICWPVFGPPPKETEPFTQLTQHGFARNHVWRCEQTDSDDEATFKLLPNEEIRKIFKPDFELLYTVKIVSESEISTYLTVKNTASDAPLPFQALLHNYFRLPEGVTPSDVIIPSYLEGLSYADKTKGGEVSKEERDNFTFEGETDRAYFFAPPKVQAAYGSKGEIHLTTFGLSDLVTWNIGKEKVGGMSDMEEGGEDRYICLEPGHVQQFITLQPGESWQGGQTLKAVL